MIIRMANLIVAALAAEHLNGSICDDLVSIHMERNAGPGLINIDHKLVIPLPGNDFVRSMSNGACAPSIDQFQLAVCDRRSFLVMPIARIN